MRSIYQCRRVECLPYPSTDKIDFDLHEEFSLDFLNLSDKS